MTTTTDAARLAEIARPTQEGYWWFRESPTAIWRVIRFDLTIDGDLLSTEDAKPIGDFDGEWSGPLTPPA